jgi:DNA processing protein
VAAAADDLGWAWIPPGDPGFPRGLPDTADPPLGLFVRGALANGPTVAIVGSRRATVYGRQVAFALAEDLGRAGVVVVSGMARGVDRAAHEGALAAGAATWAVWGAGPDRIYPAEHRGLAAAIVAGGGALMTEYPPRTPPRRHHFPERNRILAGLADVVVVVEAAARSGALVTARLALDEGREVMAVPGSVLSPLSVGPNTLLRIGARPVLSARDILDFLGLERVAEAAERARDDNPVLAVLAAGVEQTVDQISASSGLSIHDVTAALLELEVDGRVIRSTDGRYSRTGGRPAVPE